MERKDKKKKSKKEKKEKKERIDNKGEIDRCISTNVVKTE
jgi:hypothetical protein